MKKCIKCGSTIPASIVIDGKRSNLCSRKYCFSCSPFKLHNTRKIELIPKEPEGYKYCTKCKKVLLISEFRFVKQDTRLRSYCNTCNSKSVLKYITSNKQKAINYKGGKCQICGYSKYYGALEFHHRDPTVKEKLFDKTCSFDTQKLELDKTTLLCSNCHREIHGGIVKMPI